MAPKVQNSKALALQVSFLVMATFFVGLCSTAKEFKTKRLQSVVKIGDTNFLLPDGCPLPDCDDTKRSCFKKQIELKKKFNGCYVGPNRKYMGCITEYLGPDREVYVIPKFAKFCSAICYYNTTPEKMAHIHRCPFNGTIFAEADQHFQSDV